MYEGQNRLFDDLVVTCFEGYHYYMVYGLATPALIIWGK
jgi:hypothetical protein